MINNKHTMVETSLMTSEDVSARIDVLGIALDDLDNGRLVVRDGSDYRYASDGTPETLYLTTTPEVLYDGSGMSNFYNKKGSKIRVVKIMEEDIFGTTAFAGELKIGDKLQAGSEGQLVPYTDGVIEFEVKDFTLLGKEKGIIVKRTK